MSNVGVNLNSNLLLLDFSLFSVWSSIFFLFLNGCHTFLRKIFCCSSLVLLFDCSRRYFLFSSWFHSGSSSLLRLLYYDSLIIFVVLFILLIFSLVQVLVLDLVLVLELFFLELLRLLCDVHELRFVHNLRLSLEAEHWNCTCDAEGC